MPIVNPPDPVLESIDGDTYQIAHNFVVKFGFWMRELQFMIPEGFRTDLASIPWFLRWWRDRAALGTLAPVIHDYLCQHRGAVNNIQGELIQLHWFDVHLYFLVAMRIDGIDWRRALISFLGVVIFGPKW